MTDDQTIEAPAIEEAPGHPLESLIPELRIADRCCYAACGAQAFVAVLVTADNEHPLFACGHHGAKMLAALNDPFAVRDDRHKINATSESSA